MVEYTGNDVVKTTRFMDVDSEYDVLRQFEMWAEEAINSASDLETAAFFYGLYNEIVEDKDDIDDEWVDMDGGRSFVDKADDEDTYSVSPWFRKPPDQQLPTHQSVRSIQSPRRRYCLRAKLSDAY